MSVIQDIRLAAQAALADGWAIVPLLPGKKATDKAYDETISYAIKDFKWPDGNLAFKNGEPSGWRVDVDCDTPEAVAAARILLPTTGLIHGRASAPDSHYWYKSEGCPSRVFAASGKTLIEIRSSRRQKVKGVEVIKCGYTVVPPSVHEGTGESILWTVQRDPLVIEPPALTSAVCYVATVALVVQNWLTLNHMSMLPLAGFLVHAGVPEPMLVKMFEVIADLAPGGQSHKKEILDIARGTIQKHKDGQPVSGGPRLEETLGKDLVQALRGWYRVADTSALDEISKRYFVATMGKHTIVGREDLEDGVLFQQPHEVAKLLSNEFIFEQTGNGKIVRKKAWDVWMESPKPVRREYRTVRFAPPPVKCHEEDYNLWKGFSVEPGDPQGCPLMLAHIRDIICAGDLDHYAYMMNLLGLMVQQPGVPARVATVLRSGQGTGKGLFMGTLLKIFGHHAVHLNRTEQFAGKFNASLSNKVLVFADEAFFAGDKSDIGTLKRIITEDTLHIERKGLDQVAEPNFMHLFMATNEDWSYPAELDDRRGFLLEVSSAQVKNPEYFRALVRERDNGGVEALLAHLLEWPTSVDQLLPVPTSREKLRQQLRSMAPELKWWLDCLYMGMVGDVPWPVKVTNSALFAAYEQHARKSGVRHLMSLREFFAKMKDFFSSTSSKVSRVGSRTTGSKKERVQVLRTLDDARDYWDSKIGHTEEWPDFDPDTKTSDMF